MARPKQIRRINNPPPFKGFCPIGVEEGQTIVMDFDEFEALRLSDYKLYGQVEASGLMGISRSTYARIYESARKKVAKAFMEGKVLVFEGGKVYFDTDWYDCKSCGSIFNHPQKTSVVDACPLCSSRDFSICMKEPD